jgi:hypothetical protein
MLAVVVLIGLPAAALTGCARVALWMILHD